MRILRPGESTSSGQLSREDTAQVASDEAPRHGYIDGLRALAALWVVLHHALETSTPIGMLATPVVGPVLASLFFGQFPVMVFLMLSGFCLYHPLVKKEPRPPFSTGYGKYLLRRATRILPPYLSAGALCLVLGTIPALQVGRWAEVVPINRNVILTHLLLIHNVIPSHAKKIDYPMWSIGLEWQLYLLFPLMMSAFRRIQPYFVIFGTLVVAVAIRSTYRHLPDMFASILRDGPLSYLEIFAGGMLAAALTVDRRVVAPRWLLACGTAVAFLAIRFGSGNGLVHDLETGVGAFGLLMLARDSKSPVSRVLSTPWLARLGFFSYSLYLLHAPLLHLFWLALRPLHLSRDAVFLLLAFVCIPLVIVASYGFHCLFERPFMRIQRAARPRALQPGRARPFAPESPLLSAHAPASGATATHP
jgi:peptidoglycan/LPS O-acetylase OafA/YrhL